jgi:hypothetical protein
MVSLRALAAAWITLAAAGRLAAAAAAAAAASPPHAAHAAAPYFNASGLAARVIHLPSGSKPKSFAFGRGTDLFVCTLAGEVLHMDAAAPPRRNASAGARGSIARTLLATEPGVALAGIAYDDKQHALFVAGTVSGKVFVYFLSAGRPYSVEHRAAAALARPRPWQTPYANDVVLGPSHAYVTDSFEAVVHVLPRYSADRWAPSPDASPLDAGVTYLRLGPEFTASTARLSANGLALATPAGPLLVSNFDQSYVARVALPPSGSPAGAGEAAATAVVARLPRIEQGGRGAWRKVWADTIVMGEAPDVAYLSDNFEDRWAGVGGGGGTCPGFRRGGGAGGEGGA